MTRSGILPEWSSASWASLVIDESIYQSRAPERRGGVHVPRASPRPGTSHQAGASSREQADGGPKELRHRRRRGTERQQAIDGALHVRSTKPEVLERAACDVDGRARRTLRPALATVNLLLHVSTAEGLLGVELVVRPHTTRRFSASFVPPRARGTM